MNTSSPEAPVYGWEQRKESLQSEIAKLNEGFQKIKEKLEKLKEIEPTNPLIFKAEQLGQEIVEAPLLFQDDDDKKIGDDLKIEAADRTIENLRHSLEDLNNEFKGLAV